jgi:hypothetical protein
MNNSWRLRLRRHIARLYVRMPNASYAIAGSLIFFRGLIRIF